MEHTRVKLKDHIRETQLYSNRIVVSAFVIALLLIALAARMVYLQIYSHEHYATLSQNNRVNIIPVPPTRGLIYDRNGKVLAENIPTFTLEVTPEKVDNLDETIKRLKKIITISDDDVEQFYKLEKTTSAFRDIPLRFKLSEEEVAKFAVRQHEFHGVHLKADLTRYYPNGSHAVHALGYVGRINETELNQVDETNYKATTHIGKLGIEKQYEDYLHGTVGYKKVETNARGRVLRVLDEQLPVPGKDLQLTLDLDIQKIAEEKFKDQRGALVAINPKTGDIIALVSMPNYDPNLFVNGIGSKDYQALNDSPDRPLFNRAIKGRYPPGSTLKPFVGLAGLEDDVIKPSSTVDCRGYYQLKNDEHKYRDWKHIGHGTIDLHKAIQQSCDVFFYDLALRLGIDKMHDFLSYFGFGQATDIDIPGETLGILPSREWKRKVKHEAWYPGETLITGIGQGFNVVSPVQLATATAILANRGLHIRPHLGLAYQSDKDSGLVYFEPKVLGSVPIQRKSDLDVVIDGMIAVVNSSRGTARRLGRNEKYIIAGKTGTAQVFGIPQGERVDEKHLAEHLRDHALFIAFAPADDPRIAVAAIVENGESGGGVAGPIVKAVIDAYLNKYPG